MTKLTDVMGKIDTALADGTAFQKDPAKAAELSRMRGEAAATLASLEEEWLMLSSEIEEASA
jgi:ATP-binding cassette subfamily F protein 3